MWWGLELYCAVYRGIRYPNSRSTAVFGTLLCSMKRGELELSLGKTNLWWRSSLGDWETNDRDLRAISESSFTYRPKPLKDLKPGGLYVLLGPRRVGKSVELKRLVTQLLQAGVPARNVIHAACDGWRPQDLDLLIELAQELVPTTNGGRYFLLDEITSISKGWVERIKWLRDNTTFGDDTVVLSGSSARDLQDAITAWAGRRGPVESGVNVILFPMGFRAFCRAIGVQAPDIGWIKASDMLTKSSDEAIHDLRPYATDLVAAWERYLQVGGMPKAVDGWLTDKKVSHRFVIDLWNLVHRDALSGGRWAETQSLGFLGGLATGLGSMTNITRLARNCGEVHHETVESRLKALQDHFFVWPCYQSQDNRPKLRSQYKIYFLDPIQARLASLHSDGPAPDDTVLTEQQIGVTLLRQHAMQNPEETTQYNSILVHRGQKGAEIDFVGPWLKGLPYEGKYVEGLWFKETTTARAAYGKCVIATRSVAERRGDTRAVPAGILAYLLDPTSPSTISS